MSYEGYEERLCKNGHHWTDSCYGESTPCPRCKEKAVWSHSVDCTNGVEYDESGKPYPGTAPYPLKVKRYEEVMVKLPIYRIPKVLK